MFARLVHVEQVDAAGWLRDCPLTWIDNFAMRNFTNNSEFDDTLPLADGLLEVGFRVPMEALRSAMEDWFRRKGYIQPGDHLRVSELR